MPADDNIKKTIQKIPFERKVLSVKKWNQTDEIYPWVMMNFPKVYVIWKGMAVHLPQNSRNKVHFSEPGQLGQWQIDRWSDEHHQIAVWLRLMV